MAAAPPISNIRISTADYIRNFDIATEYISNIDKEFISRGIKIEVKSEYDPKSDDYRLHYELKNNTDIGSIEPIGSIELIVLHDEYSIHNLRSGSKVKGRIININDIQINESHRRQGLASKLLLYTLCKTYIDEITGKFVYIRLDDMSHEKRQLSLDSNFYIALGFMPDNGQISYNSNSTKKIIRQSHVDTAKGQTSNHLFQAVIKHLINKKITAPVHGGTRKRKNRNKSQTKRRKLHRKSRK
jgi:hypothetical protein